MVRSLVQSDPRRHAADRVETGEVAGGSVLSRRVKTIRSGRGSHRGARALGVGLILSLAVAVYPVMMMVSSRVGDRSLSGLVDQTKWTSRWAGAAAGLIERQYLELGWAPDAHWLSPASHLTAKPAFQRALSSAVGEYIAVMADLSSESGGADQDLIAASKLIGPASNAAQLHAGRQALISFDRRLRRRGEVPAPGEGQIRQLKTFETWAREGRRGVTHLAEKSSGVVSRDATVAVYSAKARAQAAFVFLDAMEMGQTPDVMIARQSALDAWREAARFRPLIVLNGSSEGSIWGNHAVTMGFLLGEAETATEALIGVLDGDENAAMIVSSAETSQDTAVN